MGPGSRTKVASRRALHRRYAPAPFMPEAPRRRRFAALYSGEPETCRRSLRPFLLNCAHLALLLAVFKQYNIEDRPFQGHTFQALVTLALLALPVHYLAPFRWKKPLFVAVSIAGLFWIAGASATAIVLAISAILIGVCYLPIPWLARAISCSVIAAVLALARPGSALAGIPDFVWPIVASMFMFRMIIYLYEIKHSKKRESLADTLNYFFMLPNYCFQLFPVVDYRTMQRGYFADDIHATQRRGLAMMFRGTLHLLCYRLVYHELLIEAADVHDLAGLVGHIVCNYLLYLRVSGQFHMACGMLHLFGYQLPETHHRYLLATSFTDYWRRINIYWKDFMVRIFFNPVVFRLKRWPQPAALAIGTAAAFLATWLLHAYQLYWLRGSWGFTVPDALFWGILGALVLVNVQFDARRGSASGNRPSGTGPGAPKWSARALGLRAAKIACTFTTIALLWSLWSSPSPAAWLDLLRRGLYGS
jgi:alginate O-acetyltransferase complex protein AlgI